MQDIKLLLAFSTTVIGLTIQSCSYSQKPDELANSNNQVTATVIKLENHSDRTTNLVADFNKSDKLTETARFLAGMNIESTSRLNQLKFDSNWLEHHRFFAHSWSKLETQQLAQARQWTKANLTEINNTNYSVFYPFSSADFLSVYYLFPQAKEYILVDSQPIGTIPDLDQLSLAKIQKKLQEVRDSLYPLLEFSFTSIDKEEVASKDEGILPILSVFVARTNSRILDIEYISLDSQASIQGNRENAIPGVKISFIPQDRSEPRTLYYFSSKLDDKKSIENSEIGKFISKSDKLVTYLNTASYSMHKENYTQIKNTILTQSNYLLQDDSGMPIDSFSQDNWDLKFYGEYSQPAAIFNKYYQPNLREVYELDSDIAPLSFNTGYQIGVNQSNLMVAKNKNNFNNDISSDPTK